MSLAPSDDAAAAAAKEDEMVMEDLFSLPLLEDTFSASSPESLDDLLEELPAVSAHSHPVKKEPLSSWNYNASIPSSTTSTTSTASTTATSAKAMKKNLNYKEERKARNRASAERSRQRRIQYALSLEEKVKESGRRQALLEYVIQSLVQGTMTHEEALKTAGLGTTTTPTTTTTIAASGNGSDALKKMNQQILSGSERSNYILYFSQQSETLLISQLQACYCFYKVMMVVLVMMALLPVPRSLQKGQECEDDKMRVSAAVQSACDSMQRTCYSFDLLSSSFSKRCISSYIQVEKRFRCNHRIK
jgi:hypothetical protein